MLLRTRQALFVDNCSAALSAEKNTIGIAPTGAGKTIMMAAVCLKSAPKELPSLVLQHRDELVTQNRDKFVRFAGIRNIRRPMTINADTKAWDHHPGGWNFGMTQTIINNLEAIPRLGMLAIDEGHHSVAPSYLAIINSIKAKNPDCLIYGTTATPNRGDRKALRTIFSNVGDQISIGELIRDGHLVRPRSFVLDIGTQGDLQNVKRTSVDFDMKEVESIMNKSVLNDKVVDHWKGFTDAAGNWISCADRQTIVFCSTTQHGKDVTAAFVAAGVAAEFMGDRIGIVARREMLARYESGETQVLVNVAILIEGFDHQPTSCVMLLRPNSWKSTMIQMIGRGLRKVDPEEYPGVIKDDCIVLDFGTSILMHGNLEDDTELHGSGTKMCPSCTAHVPGNAKECAICSHEFLDMLMPCPKCEKFVAKTARRCGHCGYQIIEVGQGGGGDMAATSVLNNFVLTEIDILQDSPFRYESFYDGRVMICFGFSHWASVVHFSDRRFYAIGAESTGDNSFKLHCLSSSDNYLVALQCADDYMRTNSNKTDAKRVAQWLYEGATGRQLEVLGENILSFGMTKYRASCAIQFKFYGNQIHGCITGFLNAANSRRRA